MYLEVSYNGEVLVELPLNLIGDATNLQPALEALFHQCKDEYGLVEEYGDDEEAIGCFVTDLEITAIYND